MAGSTLLVEDDRSFSSLAAAVLRREGMTVTLARSLHEARAALAYVSGLAHVEPGVASIYRQVQGLASDDPRHEQKSGALQKIFQANLDLRTRLEGEARGS